MPVSPATGPGDQAAFLVQARKLYVASKFKASLVHFKMALVKCSCNRDMVITAKKMGISLKEISIPTCHCKDLNALSMAPNPDKLAMYNLATKPCTCGSGLVPCDLPAHLGAIEGVAAAYDKLQAHNKALKYASLYVIMAPHAPEGYLRMAKALRLMDTSQSSDTNARCVWIYHQALESVRTYGNKHHEKLKILYSLLRKDIIVSLPSELQAMVLQYLSQAELCRCMRVTKLWNQACRNPVLWRDLKFVKNWSKPTPRLLRSGVLNDIISNRASKLAKSLAIHGMGDFGIDDTKLSSILRALPQLHSLSLKGDELGSLSTTSTPACKSVLYVLLRAAPPKLKTLRIGAFYEDSNDRENHGWEFPLESSLLQTLRELTIFDLPFPMDLVGYRQGTPPVWLKLEKLMVSRKHRGMARPAIDFLHFVTAMPALKDVSFVDCEFGGDHRRHDPTSATATWDKLERFVLREFQWTPSSVCLVPRLPPCLRFLDIDATPNSFLVRFKFTADAYESRTGERFQSSFEQLEHLRLTDSQFSHENDRLRGTFMEALSWLLGLLAPSISNGTLTSLDIPFDNDIRAEFDQVLDKQSICSLNCNALPPPPSFQMSGLLSPVGNALLTWLESFPNLDTVGLFPNDREACVMMIAKILSKESNIRTIYTNELVGVYYDDALAKAEKIGVRVIRADRVPEPVLKPLGKKSKVEKI